jgi:hypothetical protein
MAVVKSPILNNTSSSLDEFDNAVALISERVSGNEAKYWSDRMATIAAGITKPSRQQFDAIKLMFDKKVPDAPKTFDVNSKESVEVTIRAFLENNQSNQVLALQKAKDISRREEEITLMLGGDV